MSPLDTEAKLIMELCEGHGLATVRVQIPGCRRKHRLGEKVARVLAKGVCASYHLLFFL
jgi:hypothetical protein